MFKGTVHMQGGFEGAEHDPPRPQHHQTPRCGNVCGEEQGQDPASHLHERQFHLVTAQSIQILFVINCPSIRKSQLALKIIHPTGGRDLARLSLKTAPSSFWQWFLSCVTQLRAWD